MLKFNLDSKTKRIEMEVLLDGEKEPLSITVGRYELTEEHGRYFLKIHDVSASRAWIETLAASSLEGKAFEIPDTYAKLLKTVV